MENHRYEPDTSESNRLELEQWRRAVDFQNNFGSDFVDITGSTDFKQAIELVVARSVDLQSGTGADDLTLANLTWDHLTDVCSKLFTRERKLGVSDELKYTPISMAAHATDLFQHIATVAHVTFTEKSPQRNARSCNTTNRKKPDSTSHIQSLPLGKAVTFILFKNNYFTNDFVVSAQTIRHGRLTQTYIVDIDPATLVDPNFKDDKREHISASQAEKDNIAALAEVREKLQQIQQDSGRAVIIIEPFIIPGGGYIYSNKFLISLQNLCEEFGSLLVVDETLSFVRCGFPLYSFSVPNFEPHLALIGKGLGGNLLLASSKFQEEYIRRQKAELSSLGFLNIKLEMLSTYSHVGAPLALVQMDTSLRFMLKHNIAGFCNKEGANLMKWLTDHVGKNNVQGLGYALWMNVKAYEQFPIAASPNRRLLPRIDQSVSTFKYIVSEQKKKFESFAKMNVHDRKFVRVFCCARCANPIVNIDDRDSDSDQKRIECDSCTRQYHTACKNQVNGHICPCKTL